MNRKKLGQNPTCEKMLEFFFWENSAQSSIHSNTWVLFHNSLHSLFLIIRANYVQAKADLVPKFMSLRVTTTICVLYAFF